MLLIGLGLGMTGITMTSGAGNKVIKEIHELLANSFIIIMVLHLTGIAIHTIKHNDPIGKSMINGQKCVFTFQSTKIPAHRLSAGLFLVMAVCFGTYLLVKFDTESRTLSFINLKLHLSELEQDKFKYDIDKR